MASNETDKITATRTVVIAIDGSNHAERALRWYIENMRIDTDNLFLFHSIEFPPYPGMIAAPDAYYRDQMKRLIIEKTEEVKKLTTKYEQILKDENITAVFHARDGEDTGHNTCKFLKEKRADCIVIGSRGLGTIRRTFLGSTSDYVLHHAKIPVVVIPPIH